MTRVNHPNPIPAKTYRLRLRLLRQLTRKELEGLADVAWQAHHLPRLQLTHKLARWWDDRDMRELYGKLLDAAQ